MHAGTMMLQQVIRTAALIVTISVAINATSLTGKPINKITIDRKVTTHYINLIRFVQFMIDISNLDCNDV
jgi:hypothetical protein